MRARNQGTNNLSELPLTTRDKKMMKRQRKKNKVLMNSKIKIILSCLFLFMMTYFYYFSRPSEKSTMTSSTGTATDLGLGSITKSSNHNKRMTDVVVQSLSTLPNDSMYRFSFPDIFGKKINFLESFAGRISLVINVACN